MITLVKGTDTLSFTGNSRKTFINGTVVWLNGPVVKKWGRWRILKCDVDKTIVPLLYPNRSLISESYRVVVLDPGHGGKDKGVRDRWRSVEEKRVVLYLAKKIKNILKHENIKVRLTRTTDRAVSLKKRCELAKGYKADLYVSIHLNGAKNSQAKGIETHIVPPVGYRSTSNLSSVRAFDRTAYPGNRHDGANMILGYMIQQSLVKHIGGKDRGVRRSRFYVIRNVSCPAALVECGFLSNRAEAEKFISKAYRDKIAQAIAKGILSYINSVKRAHRMKQ